MNINQNPGLGKADQISVSILNADTATIAAGAPVCLAYNGTQDGLAVVLPATTGTNQLAQGMLYGVNTLPLAVGALGNAVVFGICFCTLLELQSRTSNSVSWAAVASMAVGVNLAIDTVNNMWVTAASGTCPLAVLGQTVAAVAGSASATSDTRTALTIAVKAFIRLM